MANNDFARGTLELLVPEDSQLDRDDARLRNRAAHPARSAVGRSAAGGRRSSLYPALHRMEQNGWIKAGWALTETKRKAKYYNLTAAGRRQLEKAQESFDQLVKGVRAVLRYA